MHAPTYQVGGKMKPTKNLQTATAMPSNSYAKPSTD